MDEEETEDLHEYFRRHNENDMVHLFIDILTHPNKTKDDTETRKLYFFQFPSPFPSFEDRNIVGGIGATQDATDKASEKRVSFTADTKDDEEKGKDQPSIESMRSVITGEIGQLEIFESGAVKIRLGNLLYDVG